MLGLKKVNSIEENENKRLKMITKILKLINVMCFT